jgi:hypothetical protein
VSDDTQQLKLNVAISYAADQVQEIAVLDPPRVWRVKTPDDLFWARKPVNQYQAFAECLGYRLSGLLGVDVPEFAVSYDPEEDQIFWMSEIKQSTHCDPDRVDEITNFESIGRLVLVDILIGNFDRHHRNIIVDFGDNVHAWAIDFEKARAAQPGTFDPNQPIEANGIYLELPWEMYWRHTLDAIVNAQEIASNNAKQLMKESKSVSRLEIDITEHIRSFRARAGELNTLLRRFAQRLSNV